MTISFEETGVLDDKSKTLLFSLKTFYDVKKNKKLLFEIVSSESSVSLRVLDWFVSNYSKKNATSFEVRNNIFDVFYQYKARLKSFSKKFFDPFRRGEKIILKDVVSKQCITTTVGQLNFFKWCIDNKIIDYVKTNLVDIEADMNNIQKSVKKNKSITSQEKPQEKINESSKKEQKRQQLSNSVLKTMNKKTQRIVVDFK
jgi:hypothetical protein